MLARTHHIIINKAVRKYLLYASSCLILAALIYTAISNIVIHSARSAGTTYYVDCNAANDLGSGTDPSDAWKTIEKINASTFDRGDSILFKRGCVWRNEKITNTSSSITYGAYGDGEKPSIRGSLTYNNTTDWTRENGNLWYIPNINNDPVVFSHDSALGVRMKTKDGLASQWDYWYDSINKKFYVYSNGNPASSASLLEAAVLDQAIKPITWNRVTVQDIDFRQYRGDVTIGFWGGVTGWTFRGISISQVARYGIQFHANTGNLTASIDNSSFTDWGILNQYRAGCKQNQQDGCEGYAVQAIASVDNTSASPQSLGSAKVDITNSTFTINHNMNNYELVGVMSDQGGWVHNFVGNKLINNGNWHDQGMIIWRPSGNATDITIDKNSAYRMGDFALGVQDLEYYGATPSVKIRYNYIEDADQTDINYSEALRIKNFSSSTQVEVSYNVINGTKDGSTQHDGIFVRHAPGVNIFNNTVIGADGGIRLEDASSNNNVRNNSITYNRIKGIVLSSSSSATIFDHNLFYANAAGNYQGIAPGNGDIISDPLIVKEVWYQMDGGRFYLR